MKTINTERLLLRPFNEGDAFDLYEYSKEPEVGLNAGWKPHESLEESEKILKEVFLGQPSVFAMTLNGKVIGSVGCIDDPRRNNAGVKMLGYAMGKEYWGKGYMTESVKAVLADTFAEGISLISVCCYSDNLRSKRVIEKCGFSFEGTLRQAELLPDGTVTDLNCYSLTREEYFSAVSN